MFLLFRMKVGKLGILLVKLKQFCSENSTFDSLLGADI
jgi:hypothetical protein